MHSDNGRSVAFAGGPSLQSRIAFASASDALFPVLQVDEQNPVIDDHDGIDLAVLSRFDVDLEIRVGVPFFRQMPKLSQTVDLARVDALPLVSDVHAPPAIPQHYSIHPLVEARHRSQAFRKYGRQKR
jgi:hypothetical protein